MYNYILQNLIADVITTAGEEKNPTARYTVKRGKN